jgi:protein SYS1
MSATFRSNKFDPVYTLTQILTLQSIFYLSAGVCLWLLDVLMTQGTMPTLQELFDSRLLSLGKELQGHGWRIMISFLVAGAGLGGLALMLIIRRAKLCIDFTLTLYCIHICICSLYAVPPTSLLWWMTHIISAVVMILLGEYLCMKNELEPIQRSFNNSMDEETVELKPLRH